MQNSNSIPCKIGIVGPPSAKQCVTTGKSMQCKKALETIQNFPPDSQISQCINKHNSKYVSLLSSKSTMQCCDNQGLITVSPANEWTGYELTPSPPSQSTYYKCDGSKCIVDTAGGTDYKNDPTCAKKCGKSNTQMLVMIILISLIVIVLGSVGIYFMFAKKK